MSPALSGQDESADPCWYPGFDSGRPANTSCSTPSTAPRSPSQRPRRVRAQDSATPDAALKIESTLLEHQISIEQTLQELFEPTQQAAASLYTTQTTDAFDFLSDLGPAQDPALVWGDTAGQKRAPNPFQPSAELGIWVAEQFDKTWQTQAARRHVPCQQTATSALRHPIAVAAAASSQPLNGPPTALQHYTHPHQISGPLDPSPLAVPSGNAHRAGMQLDLGSTKELHAQQPTSPFKGMANTPFLTPVQLDPYSMSQHLQTLLHGRGPAQLTANAAAAVTPSTNTEADDAASATKSECTQPCAFGPGSKRALSDVEDPDTPNLGETPPQAFGRRRIDPPADSAQARDSSQKQDDALKLHAV